MRIEALKGAEHAVQTTPETATVTGHRSANTGTYPAATHGGSPALELGQELSALVVEELIDGRVVLQFDGGILVEAENPGQLHAGQFLRLRVELLQPQVMLQIVEQELTPADQMAQLLRQKPSLDAAPWLGELFRIMETAEAPSAGAPTALEKLKLFLTGLIAREEGWTVSRLLQFVRDGGLQYEAKLLRSAATKPSELGEIADHDLKGLLLGALEEHENSGADNGAMKTITAALHDIESQQAANLLAKPDGGSAQLRIPLLIGAGFTDVALSIEADGDGGGQQQREKEPGYKILFALDLENFGRTRIDAFAQATDLRVYFYLEKSQALEQVRAMLPELQAALRGLGYREIALGARPLRDMPVEREQKFAALALGVPADVQLLNVKV